MFQFPKREGVTLPSVESWNTDNNILKLPPQAVFTRRNDKVGDDLQITGWIDDSGDRICEGISKYARGVNPMVSVSYSNYNAGTNGNPLSYSGLTEAKLPYRIMDGGAFRPPILTQEDLLPLSRLPRNRVSVLANPEFPNYLKKMDNPADFRQIKKELLQTNVRPTACFKIEKVVCHNNEAKYMIKDQNNISANSGMRTLDIGRVTVTEPDKGINHDNIHANAYTSYGSDATKLYDSRAMMDIDTDKYITEDVRHALVSAGYGSDLTEKRTIDSCNMNMNKYIADAITYNTNTNYGSNLTERRTIDDVNINTDKYIEDVLNYNTNTNYGSNLTERRTIDDVNINTDKYIDDVLVGNMHTNIVDYTKPINIEKGYDRQVHDQISTFSYVPNIRGQDKVTYLDTELDLQRKLPIYQATTNIVDNRIQKNIMHTNEIELDSKVMTSAYSNPGVSGVGSIDTISSRKAYLPPSLQKGGFENKGFIPQSEGRLGDNVKNLENHKTKLNKIVSELYRNQH
jgi:hypothetical protein